MSGECDDYDDGDVDGLVDKMEAAFDVFGGGDTMTVSGKIQWNGEYNPKAHRTTTMSGLDLNGVRQATAAAVTARQAAQAATGRHGPSGALAQFRALSKSPGGYEAMRAAGVSASLETQQRWLSGAQEPGKANREALAAANRSVYQGRADRAQGTYMRLAHAAADALTAAVVEVTGDDVRFFDVTGLEFG